MRKKTIDEHIKNGTLRADRHITYQKQIKEQFTAENDSLKKILNDLMKLCYEENNFYEINYKNNDDTSKYLKIHDVVFTTYRMTEKTFKKYNSLKNKFTKTYKSICSDEKYTKYLKYLVSSDDINKIMDIDIKEKKMNIIYNKLHSIFMPFWFFLVFGEYNEYYENDSYIIIVSKNLV